MNGPDRTPEYVECGGDLAPLTPTPHIEFRGGQLWQWFEAKTYRDGSTYTVGDWRPVPHS